MNAEQRKTVKDIKKDSDIRLKGEEKKVLIKENISKVEKQKRKTELTRGNEKQRKIHKGKYRKGEKEGEI